MKRRDFEKTIKDKGFYRSRSNKHLVFSHDKVSYNVVIPNRPEINDMICRRLLKEIDQAFSEIKKEE